MSLSENQSVVFWLERQNTKNGLSFKGALQFFVGTALLTWPFAGEMFALFCVCRDALLPSISGSFFPQEFRCLVFSFEELLEGNCQKKLCIVLWGRSLFHPLSACTPPPDISL